ncbi:MAG: flagellar motor protein MotA, partial [Mesorhizobium sp.]
MAFLRSFGRRSDVLVYDPHKLSSPQVFLLTMVIFLVIVAFIGARSTGSV